MIQLSIFFNVVLLISTVVFCHAYNHTYKQKETTKEIAFEYAHKFEKLLEASNIINNEYERLEKRYKFVCDYCLKKNKDFNLDAGKGNFVFSEGYTN
jgi:hypothetical protein